MLGAMMALGPFIFTLRTTPYQTLSRNLSQRWATNARVGKRMAYQYLGPGEEQITLSGELRPEITGGRMSTAVLRTMADTGDAWVLIGGDGYYYGLYVIESVNEGQSQFFSDGAPRAMNFSVSLKKVDDDRADMLSSLIGGLIGWLW